MASESLTQAHHVLPPVPSSVGEARRLVQAALREAGREDLIDAASLVTSELVTNALVHAGTPMGLALDISDRGLRLEIDDGNPRLPSILSHSSLTTTGRGLSLVEHLVDRWGVQQRGVGKVVWCEIGVGDLHAERSTMLTNERDDIPLTDVDHEVVPVELRNLPLLLHAAWQIHAESLLREMLLIGIDEEGEGAAGSVAGHAAASEAVAMLRDAIPAPPLRADPEAVMAEAVEPYVSARRLVVPVPRHRVQRFMVLDELMERAVTLADNGELLAPPTQPELRTFRRWLCREVVGQAAGTRPRAWFDVSLPPDKPVEKYAGWDTRSVDEAADAVVAADDHNRIVAASPSALELLGFRERGDLVGQRLVAIVPPRYRQAHLAGFTLHLFSGRSAVMGVPITLPFRCNDGSERPLEVVITAQALPHGRKVFFGRMSEPEPEPDDAQVGAEAGEPQDQ